MTTTYVSAVIPASAAEVWRLLREFGGLSGWHPEIETCSLTAGSASEVGAVRRVGFAGSGPVVVERLVALDDVNRTYAYELVEHPFAVRRSISTLRVAPVVDNGQAFVEWWADADVDASEAAEAAAFVSGLYGRGLAALQDLFAARAGAAAAAGA